MYNPPTSILVSASEFFDAPIQEFINKDEGVHVDTSRNVIVKFESTNGPLYEKKTIPLSKVDADLLTTDDEKFVGIWDWDVKSTKSKKFDVLSKVKKAINKAVADKKDAMFALDLQSNTSYFIDNTGTIEPIKIK